MDDTTVYQAAITDENISELISLRQNTVRSNASKPVSVLSKMLTRGDTKVPQHLVMPNLNQGPEKSLTQLIDNNLRMRGLKSDMIDPSNATPNRFIKVAEDFGSDINASAKASNLQSTSPKVAPTENLNTESDVNVSINKKELLSPLTNNLKEGEIKNLSKFSPKSEKRFKLDKKVKDGVDILGLDASKDIETCDSSLELILVTLSKAFSMSPK